MSDQRILVIGYGNPARGDDGLGPALAERLESMRIPHVTVDIDYQLSIEHAALVAEHDVVVFVDAARDAEGPFYFRPTASAPARACSSHAVTPAQVIALARSCFGAAPRSYVLGIRAQALEDFDEHLTPVGRAALELALAFLVRFIGSSHEGDARGEAGARASRTDESPGPVTESRMETADARRQARHSLHR